MLHIKRNGIIINKSYINRILYEREKKKYGIREAQIHFQLASVNQIFAKNKFFAVNFLMIFIWDFLNNFQVTNLRIYKILKA